MWLDRFTFIDKVIEGLSSDDKAAPNADRLQSSVVDSLLDGSTLTGAVLGG
jgi:hypothetical protein